MFLDEELQAIHDSMVNDGVSTSVDILTQLMETCRKRLIKPEDVSYITWDRQLPTVIKQVDNSWKLFVSRNSTWFKPGSDLTFRKYLANILGTAENPLLAQEFFRGILKWDLPEEWLN